MFTVLSSQLELTNMITNGLVHGTRLAHVAFVAHAVSYGFLSHGNGNDAPMNGWSCWERTQTEMEQEKHQVPTANRAREVVDVEIISSIGVLRNRVYAEKVFIRLRLSSLLIYAQLITQTKQTPGTHQQCQQQLMDDATVLVLHFIVAWRDFNQINSIDSKCFPIARATRFSAYICYTRLTIARYNVCAMQKSTEKWFRRKYFSPLSVCLTQKCRTTRWDDVL